MLEKLPQFPGIRSCSFVHAAGLDDTSITKPVTHGRYNIPSERRSRKGFLEGRLFNSGRVIWPDTDTLEGGLEGR